MQEDVEKRRDAIGQWEHRIEQAKQQAIEVENKTKQLIAAQQQEQQRLVQLQQQIRALNSPTNTNAGLTANLIGNPSSVINHNANNRWVVMVILLRIVVKNNLLKPTVTLGLGQPALNPTIMVKVDIKFIQLVGMILQIPIIPNTDV